MAKYNYYLHIYKQSTQYGTTRCGNEYANDLFKVFLTVR